MADDGSGRFDVVLIPDATRWRLERAGLWTKRDRELIEAMREGDISASAIAARFNWTAGTTYNRISDLLKKSESSEKAELVWKILKGKLPL